MKVIFVNRYFYPDCSATSQMLSDLAFELVRRGHEIHVVTSRLKYDGKGRALARRDVINGVVVHRIFTTGFGRSSIIGRVFDYLTFYLFCWLKLLFLIQKNDIVVAKTDPPLLSVVVSPITRFKGGKLVNWLQDIYPEVVERIRGGGSLLKLLFLMLKIMRNRTLRRAEINIAPGRLMAQHLRREGLAEERVHVIENWSDGQNVYPMDHDYNRLRHEWGLEGKLVIGYSGNLGRAHDLDTILDAASIINGAKHVSKKGPEIVFLFIGGGAQQKRLQFEVEKRKLKNVVFKPYQSRRMLAQSLSLIDVHLISLKPQMEGLVVPSKFYGIAAAGRPSVFIGDENGEIASILRQFEIGTSIYPGGAAELASHIIKLQTNLEDLRLTGQMARRVFDQHFDKKVGAQKWDVLLSNLHFYRR